MAKTVKAHDFPAPRSRNKYDWPTWLNGQIYVLTQGEDFDVQPANFVSSAKSYAERHGIEILVSIEDGAVYLKAVTESESKPKTS